MSKATSRPNILIFCTDEQRGDYLGCMGHPHLKTPNIDRMAAEGTLFRNCYSSCPICMPARGTMITGQTNRITGMVDNGPSLDRRIPTLPAMLADAGYRTHAVGKLHLSQSGGVALREDEAITEFPEKRRHWDWPHHWKGSSDAHFPDNYYGFQTIELAAGHVNYIYGDYVRWLEANHPGAYAGYKCNNADPKPLAIDAELHYNTWIADRSIAFIRQQSAAVDRNRSGVPQAAIGNPPSPFFLWCSFPDPHEPFAAVKKWSDCYDHVDIELPQNTVALSPESRSETMTRAGIGTQVIDPELVKKSIRQTYGMIAHVDEQVGRVLDCLEVQGIADHTVVMFISDHGDQLGEHGLFYKSVYPYDAHAHVPFLARVPHGAKGQVVEDVVSMLDMVPTVLDLAGVTHPVDVQLAARCGDQVNLFPPALPGEVLTPVLLGRGEPLRKNALLEIDRLRTPLGVLQMRALVTNDYKLVFYPLLQETMLFDRRNDPQELKNLANETGCQPVVSAMLKQLLAELARTEMPAHALCRP